MWRSVARRFGMLFSRGDDGAEALASSFSHSTPPRQNKRARRVSHGHRPSLFDRQKPFFSGIQRFGVDKIGIYLSDPFHTLLNLPWWRFILVFFLAYILQYMLFAFLYWAQSSCIEESENSFTRALWLSSRTSSTIGYNNIVPKPNCPGVNFTVMLQVICSSLVDFCMLGLVFARFSAPFKRAATIRFSETAVVNRHSSGYWSFQFRVANIRKHQILQPKIYMILTANDSITASNYAFQYMEIENAEMQQTSIQLGFPAHVTHVIRPDSPLYNLSLQELDTRLMEILVFVDGIDAMTSKHMQARKAYYPDEIHMNEQFVEMHLEKRNNKLGLDFSNFDTTVVATADALREYQSNPQLKGMSLPEVQHHLDHLRHSTFRRLSEGVGAHGAKTYVGNGHGKETGGSDSVFNNLAATNTAGPTFSVNPFQAAMQQRPPGGSVEMRGISSRDVFVPGDQEQFTTMPL